MSVRFADADGAVVGEELQSAVVPSGSVTVRCSTKVDFATRWPALRRAAPLVSAFAAATLLTGSKPRSRSRVWWWTPRRAVS